MITKNTRFLATQFLFIALLLYIVSTILIDKYFLMGYLKAFAEAAMVGGIADWFAITALFRHPLGLKIPHTAIIPRSKNRIGKNISNFIRENFLSEDYVRSNLQKFNIHQKIKTLLISHKATIIERIVYMVHKTAISFKYSSLEKFFSLLIKNKLEKLDLNPIVLNILSTFESHDYHQKVFNIMMDKSKIWLADPVNEKFVNETIKNLIKKDEEGKNTFKGVIKSFFVGDPKLYNYLCDFSNSVNKDPEQKVRKKIDALFSDVILKVKTDTVIKSKIDEIKHDILSNLSINEHIKELFEELKVWIQKDLISNDSFIKSKIEKIFDETLDEIENNKEIKNWITDQFENKIPEFIVQNAETIDNYFIEYLDKLDAKEMTKLIEDKVGDDLQFIRINGTLIGGLVGLVIYSTTQFIHFIF